MGTRVQCSAGTEDREERRGGWEGGRDLRSRDPHMAIDLYDCETRTIGLHGLELRVPGARARSITGLDSTGSDRRSVRYNGRRP